MSWITMRLSQRSTIIVVIGTHRTEHPILGATFANHRRHDMGWCSWSVGENELWRDRMVMLRCFADCCCIRSNWTHDLFPSHMLHELVVKLLVGIYLHWLKWRFQWLVCCRSLDVKGYAILSICSSETSRGWSKVDFGSSIELRSHFWLRDSLLIEHHTAWMSECKIGVRGLVNSLTH